MARKVDRRVQRTRKLLRESMLALIMDRGYDEINIQDITDHANLGRATFYLHHKDKDELLADVMRQLMDDFIDQVPQFMNSQWHLDDIKPLQKYFEFAEANYDLYRIMIFGKGGITASRQLHQNIADNFQKLLEDEIAATGAEAVIPVMFIANHLAGALLATIFWWLDNDLPYSAAEMAVMYQQINRLNREQLLRLPASKGLVAAFIENRKDKGKENKADKHEQRERKREERRRKKLSKDESEETDAANADEKATKEA